MTWSDFQLNQDPDMPAKIDNASKTGKIVNSPTMPDKAPETLEQLANKLHLPIQWIEQVDWLIRDKFAIILSGPPGSGKTYLARSLAQFYSGNRAEMVQFHPSYAYEDFVEGFRPKIISGNPSYGLRSGPIRQLAEKANSDSRLFTLVIDEINRANLSKVLGEILFALEYRNTPISTQYDSDPISLPTNLFVIGTMNTADHSIAPFDNALRRRFHFVDCSPTEEPFNALLERFLVFSKQEEFVWLPSLLAYVNNEIGDSDFDVGPSHFIRNDLSAKVVQNVWKYSIHPYLRSVYSGDTEQLKLSELAKLDIVPGHFKSEFATGDA